MIALLLLRDLIGLPAKPRPVAASRRPALPKSVPANTIPTHTNERCKRGATIMAARQGSHPKPLLFATQSLARLYSIADDQPRKRLSITSVCHGEPRGDGLVTNAMVRCRMDCVAKLF